MARGEEMRNGEYVVRGGFSELYDIGGGSPDLPRRIPLNNGSFEDNFRIKSLELMPASTDRAGGNQDDMSNQTVFFQMSVTPKGCLPIAGTTQDHDSFCLRFDDNQIIAWGAVNGHDETFKMYLDDVLIDDVYITAWSLTSAGNVRQGCAYGIGYRITFEKVKNSGAQGIVYAYREQQEEN